MKKSPYIAWASLRNGMAGSLRHIDQKFQMLIHHASYYYFAYLQIKDRRILLVARDFDVKSRLSWHQNYSLQNSDMCHLSSYQNLYDWLYISNFKSYVFLDTMLHVSMPDILFLLVRINQSLFIERNKTASLQQTSTSKELSFRSCQCSFSLNESLFCRLRKVRNSTEFKYTCVGLVSCISSALR